MEKVDNEMSYSYSRRERNKEIVYKKERISSDRRIHMNEIELRN